MIGPLEVNSIFTLSSNQSFNFLNLLPVVFRIFMNCKIERLKEARFLGVIIDERLNWSAHIKTVQSKMARYVGIMYRIKSFLPLKARIQIYQSFVQSHINYCSLVWGFSAKANINKLFVAQKKGMRAVVPGYIRYFYKDGEIPGHTKPHFNEYKILTVHGVVALNTLLFMEKIRKFPETMPESIRTTIHPEAPDHNSTFDTCTNWLSKFNTNIYRTTVFFKGPLLSILENFSTISKESKNCSVISFKRKIKAELLRLQSIGDEDEWDPQNFVLFNIPGLRRSTRKPNYPVIITVPTLTYHY